MVAFFRNIFGLLGNHRQCICGFISAVGTHSAFKVVFVFKAFNIKNIGALFDLAFIPVIILVNRTVEIHIRFMHMGAAVKCIAPHNLDNYNIILVRKNTIINIFRKHLAVYGNLCAFGKLISVLRRKHQKITIYSGGGKACYNAFFFQITPIMNIRAAVILYRIICS